LIAGLQLDAAITKVVFIATARVCGLSGCRAKTFSYTPFKTDRWLTIARKPCLAWLQHHSFAGATGATPAYCHDLKLLFCADLFASCNTLRQRSSTPRTDSVHIARA
jgi:hypothetical protein